MDVQYWASLERVAARVGAVYSDKPSWRRLLWLIARGALEVRVKDGSKFFRSNDGKYADVHERAERQRLYQEKRRRDAGILPRGAQPKVVTIQDQLDDLAASDDLPRAVL